MNTAFSPSILLILPYVLEKLLILGEHQQCLSIESRTDSVQNIAFYSLPLVLRKRTSKWKIR